MATEVPDWYVTPETFKYDADIFFGGKFEVGDALDILDKLLGLLAHGFSLPEAVRCSLDNGLLLSSAIIYYP
jgi:hypothetical protein